MNENIAEKIRADKGFALGLTLSAVFAVAFCVACLITVEFLPVSLLTPMAAQDLKDLSGRLAVSRSPLRRLSRCFPACSLQIIQATDRRYIVILFAVC